jgi:hypothetical protein
MKTTWWLRHRIPFVLALLLLIAMLGAGAAYAQTDERCFAETNQCIAGPIRAYWERNGGLPIFGYPITPQQVEVVEGQTLPVQWFERDRLEDHGAAGVMAGRLGARYLEMTDRPWEYFDKVDRAGIPATCHFFEQTGHNLCEPYLSYWQQNGGLERFGYPITQPFYEWIEGTALKVQYFERRRMEIHPEQPGGPILLGLLGNQVQATPAPSVTYPDCLAQAPASLVAAIPKLHLGSPIGCPSGAKWVALPAATQQFERGMMIWLSERKTYPLLFSYGPTIFALIDPGPRVALYDDTWQAGHDPDTPAATPPHAGLYAPWHGFGKVWIEQPELRGAIGWAIEPRAQPYTVDTQLFSHALLLRINETGVVYVFGNPNLPAPVQIVTP